MNIIKEVNMNETYKTRERYWHYSPQPEQKQAKKFSTPMLVLKNNELVVDQTVRH